MNMRLRRKPIGGWKTTTKALIVGEILLLILSWLCYKDIRFLFPLQLFLIPAYFEYGKWYRGKMKRQYTEGFRELLRSLMTSLQAGLSLENACRTARKELEGFYGRKGQPILEEIEAICRGIDLNISLQTLFYRFAENTGVEDIYEFAAVMEAVGRTGGNMVEILRNTSEHLRIRIDTEEEIRVCLSGVRFEKNIMLLMPFVMLVYLNMTGPSYVRALYETIPGRVIMTVLLFVLSGCYYWTESIMKRCQLK